MMAGALSGSASSVPALLISMNLGLASRLRLNFGLSYIALSVCLAGLLMPASIQAQSDSDFPVQITPRRQAPQPPPPAPTEGASHLKPIVSKVDMVLVPVTVTDAMNHMVTGLEKENFAVLEDDRPQMISSFYSEDVPLSLGVIFDTSKSMSNKMEKARESILDFFKTANPEDDFFVITFSDRPQLLVDFTTSIEHIENRLSYALPQGHTSLLDAVYMGLVKLRHSRYQRRALLIISDGGDNHSRYTRAEIKRIVEEADVQLYGIGIFDSVFKTPEERDGRQLLDAITQATGGRTFAIKDVKELPQAASAIALELRNQYMIGYRSDNPARDGHWRKIKIKLLPTQSRPAMHVYSKNGYYGPIE